MKTIAILPLRAGSKSIKHKNRKQLLGRPLFSWALYEAARSTLDEVYVFTDDDIIKKYIQNEYKEIDKIKVVDRSPESASDTASTEFAMQELVHTIGGTYDVLCLLQATSPLLTFKDIDAILDKVVSEGYDSALTVVENKRFFWSEDGKSLNYDYASRPRRQDFMGQLVENGAVYATTREQFESSGIRIGGNIGIVKMSEDTLVEIDEPVDWAVCSELLKARLFNGKKGSKAIKLLVLDVDGVMTDAQAAYDKNGEVTKSFSMFDGKGLELLRNTGVEIAVITSENSDVVKARLDKLKINHKFLGVKDKYVCLNEMIKKINVGIDEVAYLGDDVNDMTNICAVSWGMCPQNAALDVKAVSDLILKNKGGFGAVREASEFIIQYNRRF